MSSITPHYRNVQQLLQSQCFSIDEYQREYKWDKENIDELLSDLLEKFLNCYQPGDDTQKVSNYEDYFLGSIIVSKRGGKNYLIDGQQRVTSLTLLLIHLYRVASGFRNTLVAQSITPLIYSNNLGVLNFNLDIPERLPVIKALFDGQSYAPDAKEESIQTMFLRFGDIESRDVSGELGDAFPNFVYWLLTKVGLIEISTDNDNYAYSIFETMNDRGKPLSPVDMLKAYLLAPIENVDQRRTANHVWKQQVLGLITWSGEAEQERERDANFIKSWFRAQYADSIRDRNAGAVDKDWELIGSTFHRWVRDNHLRLNIGTEAENLELIHTHFPFFANAYKLILDASRTYSPGLESVFYVAHNEFTWQNTVLLAPLTPSDDTETVRRKIAVTATFLDIWLIRRVVNYIRIGYSSTSYAVYRLCEDIRRKTLDELVSILTQKIEADDVTFEGNKGRQRMGLEELGLNQFSRRYIFHILARITSYVEAGSGKPDLFDKYVDRTVANANDIEHITPNDYGDFQDTFADQAEFQRWRNHIAGLLILPADVNRSLQDKLFKDKAPHYAKQNLYAASLTASTYQHQPQFTGFISRKELPFQPYERFGKDEQAQRRELLSKLVNIIWSPSRLKEAAS